MEPPPPLPTGLQPPNYGGAPFGPEDIINYRPIPYNPGAGKNSPDKHGKKRYLKAVRLLNMPKPQWEPKAIAALGDFVAYITPQRVAAILLHSSFYVLEELKKDMETCRVITRNMDRVGEGVNSRPLVSNEEKLTAQKRLTEYVEAYTKLMPEVIRLAKEAHPEGSKKDRPKFNLPPSVTVPVQVNVTGATSPTAPVTPPEPLAEIPAPNGNEAAAAPAEPPTQ